MQSGSNGVVLKNSDFALENVPITTKHNLSVQKAAKLFL